MKTHWFLQILLIVGLFLIILLPGCSAQPIAETVKQPALTEAPAVEEPSFPANGEPSEEQEAVLPYPTQPLPLEGDTVTSSPTKPAFPTLIPTSIINEERLVEVEWPQRMRMGESDVVRLSLIPYQDGYIVQTEYPEHKTVTETLRIERPGGYDLFAIARLDGVGFLVSPEGGQAQFLPPEQALHWRWSLTPERSGRQRLAVSLTLRWIPQVGNPNPVMDITAYSKSLDITVSTFLGMSQTQALYAGIFGLFFGGGLSLFALTIRPRKSKISLRTETPNQELKVELPNNLYLSSQENSLLKTLFRRYTRLILEKEFLSGYSGARTFLALPIRPDGRADAYTIAKLGEVGSIQQEYNNYLAFVKNTLPPITARIQHSPVTTSSPSGPRGRSPIAPPHLAALQYTFISEPGATPSSLRQVLLADPDPDLLYKLFDTFGPNWWMQRRPHTFRLAYEYDRMLPTHLVIEPENGRGKILDAHRAPPNVKLHIGDVVTLRNFSIEGLRADGQSLSLLGKTSPGLPPLRIRWLSTEKSHGVSGRVIATRSTLLRQYTTGFDLCGLPDPFEKLLEYLNTLMNGTASIIHGDLNLENVLVGPGGLVWLIDFAQTREGHTLYDFAHLEAEVIAHIIAPNISKPDDYITLLTKPSTSPFKGLHSLLDALENITSRCLFNPSHPQEYQIALSLACMGALKFNNLDQHAKHLLYLTAAYQAQVL